MPEVRAQIILSAKTEQAEANLKKVGQTAGGLSKDLKKGFGDAVQNLTGFNLATLGVAGAIGAVGLGLKVAIDNAAEAEKVMAQTQAVIKSTGGVAGLTADEIARMSGALSQLTATDDEAIQSAANVLLTFKAVKEEAFEPALLAALDMSKALGVDLKGSVIQVGKALEDPIRGLTALRRSGVSFTAEQQKLIRTLVETGRAADAQAVILEELNKQFGGSAQAQAETYAGQIELLKVNMGNLAQTIGEELLPPLTDFLQAINNQIRLEDTLQAAIESGAVSQDERVKIYLAAKMGATNAADAIADLTTRTEAHTAAMAAEDPWLINLRANTEKATVATGAYDYMIGQAVQTTNDYRDAQAQAAQVTADAARQSEAYQEAQANARAAEAEALQSVKDLTVGYYDLAAALKDATAQELAQEQLSKLQELFERGALSEEEYRAATEGLGLAYGIFTPQSLALASATDTLVKLYAAGRITADELTTATSNLEKAAADGKVDIEELGISVDEKVTPAFSGARDQAEQFEGALNRLDGRTVTNTVVTNYVETREYRTTGEGTQHSGGRAHGGPVMGGNAYLVGERGPELFVPNVAGTVVPNGAGMGGNEELIAVLLDLPNAVGRAVRDNLALVT